MKIVRVIGKTRYLDNVYVSIFFRVGMNVIFFYLSYEPNDLDVADELAK